MIHEVCIKKRGWWFRECYFKLLAVPAWQMSFIIGELFYYPLNLLWINFRSYSPFLLILSLWKLKLVIKSELNLKSKCFREAFGNAKSCVLRFLVNLNQNTSITQFFFFVIVFFCLKLSVDLVLQNCNILVPCATNRAEITRVWRSLGCSLITVSSFSLSLNSPESCCGGCTSLLTPLFTLQNFILNLSTQPKLSNSLKIKHLWSYE